MLFALATLSLLASACAPLASAMAADWRPDLVALDESGDRNIPNHRFDATHTAAGHFMITDTNWRYYAPMLGIDLGMYPNAMSAPEQLQGQVAGLMWARERYLPWVPFNPRLKRDLDHLGPASAGNVNNSIPKGESVSVIPNVPPAAPEANPFREPSTTPRVLVFNVISRR